MSNRAKGVAKTLRVENLPLDYTKEMVAKELFKDFSVVHVQLYTQRKQGVSSVNAGVVFESHEEAEAARAAKNKTLLQGYPIEITWKHAKSGKRKPDDDQYDQDDDGGNDLSMFGPMNHLQQEEQKMIEELYADPPKSEPTPVQESAALISAPTQSSSSHSSTSSSRQNRGRSLSPTDHRSRRSSRSPHRASSKRGSRRSRSRSRSRSWSYSRSPSRSRSPPRSRRRSFSPQRYRRSRSHSPNVKRHRVSSTTSRQAPGPSVEPTFCKICLVNVPRGGWKQHAQGSKHTSAAAARRAQKNQLKGLPATHNLVPEAARPPPPSRLLYVWSYPNHWSERELENFFGLKGRVLKLITRSRLEHTASYALILYASPADAARAAGELNGWMIQDVRVQCGLSEDLSRYDMGARVMASNPRVIVKEFIDLLEIPNQDAAVSFFSECNSDMVMAINVFFGLAESGWTAELQRRFGGSLFSQVPHTKETTPATALTVAAPLDIKPYVVASNPIPAPAIQAPRGSLPHYGPVALESTSNQVLSGLVSKASESANLSSLAERLRNMSNQEGRKPANRKAPVARAPVHMDLTVPATVPPAARSAALPEVRPTPAPVPSVEPQLFPLGRKYSEEARGVLGGKTRKKFEVDLSQLPKSACELLDNELLIFLGERLYTGCHPALGTAPCLVAYHKNTLQTEQGTPLLEKSVLMDLSADLCRVLAEELIVCLFVPSIRGVGCVRFYYKRSCILSDLQPDVLEALKAVLAWLKNPSFLPS